MRWRVDGEWMCPAQVKQSLKWSESLVTSAAGDAGSSLSASCLYISPIGVGAVFCRFATIPAAAISLLDVTSVSPTSSM